MLNGKPPLENDVQCFILIFIYLILLSVEFRQSSLNLAPLINVVFEFMLDV